MKQVIRQAWSFHRVLTAATLVSIALVLPPLFGMMFDPKIITGVNAWIKPLKFAMSSAIYAASFLWLLTFVQGRPRLVGALGNVTGVVLVLEVALIAMQVARGTTSHFNASTPFDAAVFSVMGGAITVLALMCLTLAILLLRQRMPDRVFGAGVRFGVFASLLGMTVAFFMTSPTPEQLEAIRGGAEITAVGAHSVGVADGGPGLPFVGWSLEGGDLRVPHFVGIHGVQALALLGWLLALPTARRRWHETQRIALVRIGGAAYIGWVGLLTWQALRGQSVLAPDGQTVIAYAALLGSTLAGAWLVTARRSDSRARVPTRNDSDSSKGKAGERTQQRTILLIAFVLVVVLPVGAANGAVHLVRLPDLGLELDELCANRRPVVAEQSQRFVLHLLPPAIGAVVSGDALRREPGVALPPVVIVGEVDEPVAHEWPDVAADGRGIRPNGVSEVAKRHAPSHSERGENRPLGAADARLPERVVVRGRQSAAGSAHASPDAADRRHDVDVEILKHNLYMHLSLGNARTHNLRT